MAEPLVFQPYLQWVDVPEGGPVPPGARPITAADLLRFENYMAASKTRINEHDAAITNVASAPYTPFVVTYNGTVWRFASLAEATAAGYKTGQTMWFIGTATMPAWAPVGSVITQG